MRENGSRREVGTRKETTKGEREEREVGRSYRAPNTTHKLATSNKYVTTSVS